MQSEWQVQCPMPMLWDLCCIVPQCSWFWAMAYHWTSAVWLCHTVHHSLVSRTLRPGSNDWLSSSCCLCLVSFAWFLQSVVSVPPFTSRNLLSLPWTQFICLGAPQHCFLPIISRVVYGIRSTVHGLSVPWAKCLGPECFGFWIFGCWNMEHRQWHILGMNTRLNIKLIYVYYTSYHIVWW
jgi:hypothetical protein